ncbi:hypothetical protein KCP71_10495 [Salmonella enterica subsp. enterica]|nr:hypothetical protein KCP71_10495 [Salmonella enterica subsp. enterica]
MAVRNRRAASAGTRHVRTANCAISPDRVGRDFVMRPYGKPRRSGCRSNCAIRSIFILS